jgi:hypothetical protein
MAPVVVGQGSLLFLHIEAGGVWDVVPLLRAEKSDWTYRRVAADRLQMDAIVKSYFRFAGNPQFRICGFTAEV